MKQTFGAIIFWIGIAPDRLTASPSKASVPGVPVLAAVKMADSSAALQVPLGHAAWELSVLIVPPRYANAGSSMSRKETSAAAGPGLVT